MDEALPSSTLECCPTLSSPRSALVSYKERHLVEYFINKIKHYRGIFSRFEKLAEHYLGFLCFASALICLR
jgi:transposase